MTDMTEAQLAAAWSTRRLTEAIAAPQLLDADGLPLSPEAAATHATVVQGGFSTPEIEARRMLRAGGVLAERARAWLAEQPRVVRNCCECDAEFVVDPLLPRQIRCGPCQVESDFG